MDIELVRGNDFNFKFKRVDRAGNIIMIMPQKMWFTVREPMSDFILFQKELGDGITFTETDGYYHVQILSNDTKNSKSLNYKYSVVVEINGRIKTLKQGLMKLKRNVNHEGGS